MIPMPHEGLADSILHIRTCLSRVELAASRLAREATTPVARDLVAGISQAVQEIDDEIGEALLSLRTESNSDAEVSDCSHSLEILRDRMSPILHAHGIHWLPREIGEPCLTTNRDGIELAALVMLRTGIALAGHGGTIDLELVRDPETSRIGLRLAAERVDASEGDPDTLIHARALAERHRGSLIVQESAGSHSATLWLTSSEAE